MSIRILTVAACLTASVFAAQSPMPAKTTTATHSAISQPKTQTADEWEEKFRAIPSPDSLRAYMQRLSARPHHLGSPYGKNNAEWMLRKFRSWGLEAQIETYEVLFPTPKERVVELVEPHRFKAKLMEPAVPGDPTSGQHDERLHSYNGYPALRAVGAHGHFRRRRDRDCPLRRLVARH